MKTFGVILFNQKQQVLLVHQVYSNKWSFPKGQDDKEGETNIACAMRELKEEAGIYRGSYRILGHVCYYTHTFFIAVLNKAENVFDANTNDPGEIDDISWVDFKHLRQFAKSRKCNSTIGGLVNSGKIDEVEKLLKASLKCKEYVQYTCRAPTPLRSDANSWRVN